MTFARPLALAALGLLTALPAAAQTTITGIRTINDEIDNLRRDAEIEIARGEDPTRFGPSEQRQGVSGSLSLGFNASDGSTEEQDLSFGARLTSARGPLVQTLGFLLSFSEEEGVNTEEDIFAIYDLTYDWNTNAYGFILGRVSSDGLADEADEVKLDGFLGVGPGYRVINRPDMTWRLQAGVGVSYLEYGDGVDETEPGVIVASRFYAQLSDNAFLTNDTDVLSSDTALRASNDFGVNLRVTDAVSTRLSYVTEYNDSRAIRTDNKLAISLVYGF
jgi:putative salt-induced outer membrane protein